MDTWTDTACTKWTRHSIIASTLVKELNSVAKAQKLKSGNYRCKANYTDELGNQKCKSFTAGTKKEAEAQATLFLMERKHDSKPENITLGQLADRFIENRSNLLSPSTVATYRKLRRVALQDIIDVRIGLLTKELYQKAINTYSKGRTYKTVVCAHTFYKHVLNENGVHITDKINLPQKDEKEISIPTTEELNEFLAFIKDSRIYNYVLFSVYLGLRRSETIALRWGDIDFVKKTVFVNRARVKNEDREWEVKQTKSFSGKRKLDAPQALLDAIEPFRGAPDTYVIEDKPDALESLYKRAIVKANFPYNFHSLRHYYASIMLAEGVPNKYARERMGHKTDNMLNKVYQHTMTEYNEAITAKLEKFFTDNIKVEEKE